MDNSECVWPVHRNGSRIVTAIMEFNSYREAWGICSLVIAYGLFRIIQSLTTMWFISVKDTLIVHYLAKTRGWFETSTKMSQASILSFFSSNLAEKRVQMRKSSDFAEGLSAIKSLKCLGPSEINVSVSEALFVLFFFFSGRCSLISK